MITVDLVNLAFLLDTGSVAKITTSHNRAVAAAVQAAVWNSPAMKAA